MAGTRKPDPSSITRDLIAAINWCHKRRTASKKPGQGTGQPARSTNIPSKSLSTSPKKGSQVATKPVAVPVAVPETEKIAPSSLSDKLSSLEVSRPEQVLSTCFKSPESSESSGIGSPPDSTKSPSAAGTDASCRTPSPTPSKAPLPTTWAALLGGPSKSPPRRPIQQPPVNVSNKLQTTELSHLSPLQLLNSAADLWKACNPGRRLIPKSTIKGPIERVEPTERELEENLAAAVGWGEPRDEAHRRYLAAVNKAQVVVADRAANRKLRVKRSRFVRTEGYIYEKPMNVAGNWFAKLPLEIVQKILACFVGTSRDLLNLAATCQVVSDLVFNNFNIWDVNDGGFLNNDHNFQPPDKSKCDCTFIDTKTRISKRTFTQIVGSKNPKYHNIYYYDMKATLRMISSCHNFAHQIQHLEFHSVPLLTLKVLETCIGHMYALKFFRVERCPMLDFSDTIDIMRMCLPEYTGGGPPDAPFVGRKIDFDFRPYVFTMREPFDSYHNVALPVVLSLRTFLPVAASRRMSIASTSSAFYNEISNCHDRKTDPKAKFYGQGINKAVWKQLCMGTLSSKELIKWAQGQEMFNMRRMNHNLKLDWYYPQRCEAAEHNILSKTGEVRRFTHPSVNVVHCLDHFPTVFCAPLLAWQCLGCKYKFSLSQDKRVPWLAKRGEEIDQMISLAKDELASLKHLYLPEDTKTLLRNRLKIWLTTKEECALQTVNPYNELREVDLVANRVAVFEELVLWKYANEDEKESLNAAVTESERKHVRNAIHNRIYADDVLADSGDLDLERNKVTTDIDNPSLLEQEMLIVPAAWSVHNYLRRYHVKEACDVWESPGVGAELMTWDDLIDDNIFDRLDGQRFSRIEFKRDRRALQHSQSAKEVTMLRDMVGSKALESKYGYLRDLKIWDIGEDYKVLLEGNFW
ncbi:MAG: hypothetical protein M1814_001122 [Vezdaea aestivalis]|nr:MAG: hypothetical protein M1814_001122 [Vezdaea aestivalis]